MKEIEGSAACDEPLTGDAVESMEAEEDDGCGEGFGGVGGEDEEGGIEGEGDEIEEEEEEYRLEFDGEVDPLDLALQGGTNDGVELYKQFKHLEYEALAQRKRKVLEQQSRVDSAKKPRQDEYLGVTMEEINKMMNFGSRRRSKVPKKRGRKKGSKQKLTPAVSKKIGDATLHMACAEYDKAISILEEIVRIAPNLPDAYHLLGLIYKEMNDRKKAVNFHMIAAHLSPKDPSLWKSLIAWSIEEGNTGQVRYCLSKAITADPTDVSLRFDRASLHLVLGEYLKAAECYDQIVGLHPANLRARKMAAKMYQKCGQIERAISVLEDYASDHSTSEDRGVLDLLVDLYMENNMHLKALKQIEHVNSAYGSEKEKLLNWKVKGVICHAYLGNLENVENLLQDFQLVDSEKYSESITKVADSLTKLGYFSYALKFYCLLEGQASHDNGNLNLKIAQCYSSLMDAKKAIPFFYQALSTMEDNVDVRLTLSSLLLKEGKEDEAVSLLSPPESPDKISDLDSAQTNLWWLNGKVRLQLAKIYRAKKMVENFVAAIFLPLKETLVIETMNQKVKPRKKLENRVLAERVKLLGDQQQTDNVFSGFRPIATTSELLKASRARKLLQKKEAIKEEKKAAALAAGLDWLSEDSEDEAPRRVKQESPLPGFLKDDEHHQLISDLCKSLASLQRYSDALEIILSALKLSNNILPIEMKEELQSLGAQIAYNSTDPNLGYDFARKIVQQHPHSNAAWNCYYRVVSRFENRSKKHLKFLLSMRAEKDFVPRLIMTGHQFTMLSQHQAAAREYLEAYKLEPENPLINLCVGTALINLALGFRLQNKHQCMTQGLAFLHNYLRICNNSQEALYNIARAYHHVGLVTLAASYYERVLAVEEKDHPIPKFPYEEASSAATPVNQAQGCCNLHREAAYNLHLIYKKSGAVDLARQTLKTYCTP